MRLSATIALLLAPAMLSAQQLASSVRSPRDLAGAAVPARATATSTVAVRASHAPVLDGKDDDAVWASAQLIDGFRVFDPTEDGDPHFKTEAKVAYDDRNLYVFVRAFDPHPDSIVSKLSRRDERTESDQIKVMIDSYHDRRSGYEFAVNPAGVKRDYYTFNDGDEDGSWDAVWYVATRIDSLGWTAEFRIPFSQLRYAKADVHTFGLLINRDVARTSERVSWPVFRRSKTGIASQFGEVSGIQGIAAPRRLEVAPYTVAKTRNVANATGGYRGQSTGTVGADVKYGITSNLTLDATVNPDFGQVEADPSVLNLSAAETFYPEKRPFFLEGQGVFHFDVNCNDGTCSGLFYSRRIGRAPQLSDDYYYDASNPQSSTILGAGKITGRLGNGLSVGMLDAVTQRATAPGDRTIEPATNYFVGRLQQDLRGGASAVGVMATAVNRSVDSWSEPYLRRSAYVGGVDARHEFANRRYRVSAYVAASEVAGSASAIALTQQDFVHNYSRPGDALAYDPTRTSLGGTSAQFLVEKIAGTHTRFSTGYQWLSPGFEINDVGYLSRANAQNQFFWWQWHDQTLRPHYKFWNFNVNEWVNWTAAGERVATGGNVNSHMQLRNNWWLHWGQGIDGVGSPYCDLCLRGGPAVKQSPSLFGWLGFQGDTRRTLAPNFFLNWNRGDEGRSYSMYYSPGLDVQASSRWSGHLSVDVTKNVSDLQPRGNYGDIGADSTHYTVARLDQTTAAITTRLNFTATPNLSLQIYAQPFVTSGAYTDWRQLADPTSSLIANRYAGYGNSSEGVGDWNFNFKQYRSNTVVRWEYRPGSVLYFVWAQERTESLQNIGTFSAQRDYRTLFDAHPGNVFLIKGSYWINW